MRSSVSSLCVKSTRSGQGWILQGREHGVIQRNGVIGHYEGHDPVGVVRLWSRIEHKGIRARSAVERVHAKPTDQTVILCPAGEAVAIAPAQQRVVSVPAAQGVTAVPAFQGIRAARASDAFVFWRADHLDGEAVAGSLIVGQVSKGRIGHLNRARSGKGGLCGVAGGV
jgi:hypothetical protein